MRVLGEPVELLGEPVELPLSAAKRVRPLTGNEAIARGAWEAGVKVAAAYPGTPSTEILETLATYPAEDIHAQWSTNEKVALDVAMGASFAGRRALAAMKHVGLNVAADAFMSQAYIGVNGGLVLAVCDDPGIHSSQNEQDTRLYGALAIVPVLEPSDAQEALDFTRLAFELSERFDTPVIVRGTTRLSHTRSPVVVGSRTEAPARGFLEQPSKNVMIPAYAKPRHGAVLEREARLKEYFGEASINRWEAGDAAFGVVTAGTCYPYVREVLPSASVLKLGASWPLPEGLLRRFCELVERVFVVEELEPVIEKEIRALGFAVDGKRFFPRVGELGPEIVRAGFEQAGILPPRREQSTWAPEPLARPPVLCAGCPHISAFMAVRASGARVAGDIGCYTLACLDPLRGIDTTVSMGSSIGNAIGMAKAGEPKPIVATIGDFDVPARRNSRVDRRGLQPCRSRGAAARQPCDRDDGRAESIPAPVRRCAARRPPGWTTKPSCARSASRGCARSIPMILRPCISLCARQSRIAALRFSSPIDLASSIR